MPLSFASEGSKYQIAHIGGTPGVRQHLCDLGFNVGSDIMVISKVGDNLIVKVKEARVGISREMASKIMV